MSGSVSVCTIVRGRRPHLANLMGGLAWQTRPADELIIAYMQHDRHKGLPDPGCPVRSLHVEGDPMPLAAARNRAAAAASGKMLVFLDVDCIPSPGLIDAYRTAVAATHAVCMGEVFYLPPRVPEGVPDPGLLDAAGVPHPSKAPFPAEGWEAEPDHGQLWGLSFALPAACWGNVGGMDEGYAGYGGEETDFAATLEAAGIPLYRVAGARCWHQHHPVTAPPLDRFDDIVRNARRFHAKWGRWCMDYWLEQFAALGLLALSHAEMRILRRPTSTEIQAAQQSTELRFS